MASIIRMIEVSVTGAGSVSALTLPEAAAGALALYLLCLALFFRRLGAGRNVCIALLFLYAGALFALTVPVVLPEVWHVTAAGTDWALHSIQWVPFVSAAGIYRNSQAAGNWSEFVRLIVGNAAVFVPLGILAPLASPRCRLGRSVLLAFLVPVCIEALQLLGNILAGTAIRTVETEDVLLNAAGWLFGYLIYSAFRRLFRPKHHAKHYR